MIIIEWILYCVVFLIAFKVGKFSYRRYPKTISKREKYRKSEAELAQDRIIKSIVYFGVAMFSGCYLVYQIFNSPIE